MTRRVRCPSGAALLEVVVALVVLAVAGTGLVTMLGQTRHTMASLVASERQTRAAGRELDALVLLGRDDLSARIGTTSVHGFQLTIDRVAPDLFDARVAAASNGPVLLRTTLYRPDMTHDTT
jgi:type II secretory pathway pseudopilin PulG